MKGRRKGAIACSGEAGQAGNSGSQLQSNVARATVLHEQPESSWALLTTKAGDLGSQSFRGCVSLCEEKGAAAVEALSWCQAQVLVQMQMEPQHCTQRHWQPQRPL